MKIKANGRWQNVKPERHQWRVWVGLVDTGKGLVPHVYECEFDGRCVAVFPTKKAARSSYECVRRAELVWSDSLQETRKKMTGRRAGPRQREGL